MQTKKGISENFDWIVLDTVSRDRQRFKGKNRHFYENTTEEIKFGLQALSQNPAWENQYNDFLRTVVFQRQRPTFQEVIKTLDQLSARAFHAIKSSEKCLVTV